MSVERLRSLPAVYGKLIGEEPSSRQDAAKHSKQNEWIWEYVLKHCKDFRITTALMEAVPIPDTVTIKKLALLKLVSLDISSGLISERDLFALQGLEDLIRDERRRNNNAEDAQRAGLDAVLPKLQLVLKAELVLQHLRDGKDDWRSFSDALERHWGETVQDTEEAVLEDGLIEETRKELKSDLWGLQAKPRMKDFILSEHKREHVDEMMKEFLDLAWKELGPTFLERAEEDILKGRYVPVGDKRASHVFHQDGASEKNKRIRKTLLPSLGVENEAAVDGSDSPCINRPPWTGEGEANTRRKLTRRCVDELKQPDVVRSPAVERALNDLKTSQSHLRQHVKDPLPGAIEVAKDLKRPVTGHETGGHPVDYTTERLQEATASKKPIIQNDAGPEIQEQIKHQVKGQHAAGKTKVSVMERNPSARTCEWDEDDDIEESPQEASPSASKRVHLPSTSTKQISPLRKGASNRSLARRRKINKWTPLEEETLRREVEAFGKGRWKAILQNNLDVFQNRTEVDLKDKWRNIERAEGIVRNK